MHRTKELKRSLATHEFELPAPNSASTGGDTTSGTTSALSTSNTPSTNNTSPTRKKTRQPASPRLKQTQKSATSSPLSRQPASPRKRPEVTPQDKPQDKALAESFADERQTKRARKSDSLTESSADDSVKKVSILDFNEFDDSMGNTFESTEPRLRARSSHGSPNTGSINKLKAPSIEQPIPSAVTMLAGMIWAAMERQDWDKLGNLLDSMHEHQFRFDDPALKDSAPVQQIIEAAPLALLMDGKDASGTDKISRWLLALDLFDLGCNWDAKDQNGVRAINLLRQQASKSLIDHVVSERPEFKHLLLPE
jgi:hypothetical protein